MRKKISTTVYLDPEQAEALRSLSRHTRVTIAAYIREGVELVREKHAAEIPGTQFALPLGERIRRKAERA